MSQPDGGRFAAEVTDPRRHVVADFSSESETLLVVFGGIAGGVSMPVYEFFRISDGYPVKRLFLRDPVRSWYLRGLPGIGNEALTVRDALDQAIADSGATRVVLAGASAGGFAALLFGAWLRADAVVAFSPQSFLGGADRREAGDDRWPDQIASLHAALGAEHPHYDVLPHLEATPPSSIEIHVSGHDHLDLAHARRLAVVSGASVREHGNGGHRLVKALRDSGALRPILLRSLGLGDEPLAIDRERLTAPSRRRRSPRPGGC